MDRDTCRPQWVVEVLAQDNERGEVIRVTVNGDQPKVTRGARSASTPWRRSPGTTTARQAWPTCRREPPCPARPRRLVLALPAAIPVCGDRLPHENCRVHDQRRKDTRCHDQQHRQHSGR